MKASLLINHLLIFYNIYTDICITSGCGICAACIISCGNIPAVPVYDDNIRGTIVGHRTASAAHLTVTVIDAGTVADDRCTYFYILEYNSCLRCRRVDTAMRSAPQIDVAAVGCPPGVGIMNPHSAVKRHPVLNRCLIIFSYQNSIFLFSHKAEHTFRRSRIRADISCHHRCLHKQYAILIVPHSLVCVIYFYVCISNIVISPCPGSFQPHRASLSGIPGQ